jgi:putative DNA primase/helicase
MATTEDLRKYFDGTPEEEREDRDERARLIPPPDEPREVAKFVQYRVFGRDRIAHDGSSFWTWTGTHWRHEAGSFRLEALIAEWLDGKKYTTPKGLAAPWKVTPKRVADVLKMLAGLVLRDEDAEPFGSGYCVALENCVLDIRTGRTYAHTPEFWTPYALDFPYDPEARSHPAWTAFLDSVFGDDDEARDCLQEIMGYVLAGTTELQKVFLLIGPKRAGKGTIFRVLAGLVGPSNVCSPTLSVLGEHFGAATLIGKPVALIGEAREMGRNDKGTHAAVERLLTISGEDVQTIPRKNREDWTGRIPTRFVMSSNVLPNFRDGSGALASRFVLLNFTESFYGREDLDLDTKLHAERAAIFNWALDGFPRLMARGRFVQPESGVARLTMLEDMAAPVAAFVRDWCEVGPDCRVAKNDLYNAWKYWNELHGHTSAGPDSNFYRDLYAAFPEVKSYDPGPRADDRRPHVRGIRLREDEQTREVGG